MYIDICERLEELGYDVVAEAVKLLRKRTMPTEYRVRLLLGIMAHSHPKRIATVAKTTVEHKLSREQVVELMKNPELAEAMQKATFILEGAKRPGSGLAVPVERRLPPPSAPPSAPAPGEIIDAEFTD